MICKRCVSEAQAAINIRADLAGEADLVNQVLTTIAADAHSPLVMAQAVIDLVREHDEQTLLMREALEDHTAQNNEGAY